MKEKRLLYSLVSFIVCLCLVLPVLPQTTLAKVEYGVEITENGFRYWGRGSSDSSSSSSNGSSSGQGSGTRASIYQYEMASTIEEMIAVCQKYDDRSVITGVRSQINWMNELYQAAVQDFAGQLGLGDTLLLAILNHSDINSALMMSSYSTGDINREVAKRIAKGAAGYVDVDTIAKATGLKAKDVKSILERIASGSITERTIAVGKNRTRASSRGVYVNHQALKQDKVWKYLVSEVEHMTSDPDDLAILYQDLGTGYVENMLSGQEMDNYLVSLYKKELAGILDDVLNSGNPVSISTITKSDPYKVTKKTQSALSKLWKYEMAAAEDSLNESLSAELVTFLEKHKGSGSFNESTAKEYLILSGQFEEGEYGIEEAAKLLSNSHKHLKSFETVMSTAGKAFNLAAEAQKIEELIEYVVKDYTKQEILLNDMIETLSGTGADIELMAAARDLKEDYENKLSGTFDNIYEALMDEGISSVKAAFPPLGIAEACISLAGTISGASDTASALETGFAMQGICKQAMEDYENAVKAVNDGDTGGEAISKVLTTFETARQSLVSYYEAMVTLAETKEQKNTYSEVLKDLKKVKFGYATVSLPFNG